MQALAFYFFAALTLIPAAFVILARNPVHSIFSLIFAFFGAAGLFVLLGAEFLAMMLVVVYVGAVAVLFLFVIMMLDLPFPHVRTWFRAGTAECRSVLKSVFKYLATFCGTFIVLVGGALMLASQGKIVFGRLGAFMDFMDLLFDSGEFQYIIPLAVILVLSFGVARSVAQWVSKFSFMSLLTQTCITMSFGWMLLAVLSTSIFLIIFMWGETSSVKIFTYVNQISNTQAIGNVLYTNYIYAFQLSGLILLVAMIGAIVLTLRRRGDVKRQDISEQVRRTKEESVSLQAVKVGEGVKWQD